jgi:hypothetical protein
MGGILQLDGLNVTHNKDTPGQGVKILGTLTLSKGELSLTHNVIFYFLA